MKKAPAFLASTAALLVSASTAHAALTVVYETDFSAPAYSDGELIGQDSWIITGTSVVSPISVSNSATDGLVSLTPTGQDVRRNLGLNVSSGSVFVEALINVSTAQSVGDYFLHLGQADNTFNFYARAYIRSAEEGFVMALGTSSGAATYGTTVIPYNTPTTVLLRYDFVDGAGNDTGALFVNPSTPDGISDTPYLVATTTGTDSDSISTVNLRQGSASNAPTLTVSSLTVSVPEPSTALLGAFGLLAMLRRRR